MAPKTDLDMNPVFLRAKKKHLLEWFEHLQEKLRNVGEDVNAPIDAWSEALDHIMQDYGRITCALESIHGDPPYKEERLQLERSYIKMRAFILKKRKGTSGSMYPRIVQSVTSLPASANSRPTRECVKCQQNHLLHQCSAFKQLSKLDRLECALSLKVCLNCLRKVDHVAKTCPRQTCIRCFKKHNTLLHGAQFVLPSSSGSQSSRVVSMVTQLSSPQQIPKVLSQQDNSDLPRTLELLDKRLSICDTLKASKVVIVQSAVVKNKKEKMHEVFTRCLLDSALCQHVHLSGTSKRYPVRIGGIAQTTIKASQLAIKKVPSITPVVSIVPQLVALPSLAIKSSVSNIPERSDLTNACSENSAFSVSEAVSPGTVYVSDILRNSFSHHRKRLSSLQKISSTCLLSGHRRQRSKGGSCSSCAKQPTYRRLLDQNYSLKIMSPSRRQPLQPKRTKKRRMWKRRRKRLKVTISPRPDIAARYQCVKVCSLRTRETTRRVFRSVSSSEIDRGPVGFITRVQEDQHLV